MAGIYPEGGVNAGTAINSIPNQVAGEDYVDGCPPRWFGQQCRPLFDPAAGNAVISEIINVLRDRGIPYDCSKLDNLSRAVGPHLISYEKTVLLPEDPWPVKNGDDVIIRGTFTVPNSYALPIRCLAIAQLTVLVKTLAAGNDENLDVNLTLSYDSAYDGQVLYSTIQMRRNGSTDFDSWQTVKTNVLDIPPGGRTFFYELSSKASANLSFQLKEDFVASKWRFYGISCMTSDILSE